MLKLKNKGQSILEYAILLGVILVAILVMQVFIKRGYQGGLKESAGKMGDAYSASSTWILQNRSMQGNQKIYEETATPEDTTSGPGKLASELGFNATGTVAKGAYSYQNRTMERGMSNVEPGTTSQTERWTAGAKDEKVKWDEYRNYTIDNDLERINIWPQ